MTLSDMVTMPCRHSPLEAPLDIAVNRLAMYQSECTGDSSFRLAASLLALLLVHAAAQFDYVALANQDYLQSGDVRIQPLKHTSLLDLLSKS